MTTPAEKVALDVIFAALNSANTERKPRDVVAKKLAVLLGAVTYICKDHGVPFDLAVEMLQYRWNEYEETFGAENG